MIFEPSATTSGTLLFVLYLSIEFILCTSGQKDVVLRMCWLYEEHNAVCVVCHRRYLGLLYRFLYLDLNYNTL